MLRAARNANAVLCLYIVGRKGIMKKRYDNLIKKFFDQLAGVPSTKKDYVEAITRVRDDADEIISAESELNSETSSR